MILLIILLRCFELRVLETYAKHYFSGSPLQIKTYGIAEIPIQNNVRAKMRHNPVKKATTKSLFHQHEQFTLSWKSLLETYLRN